MESFLAEVRSIALAALSLCAWAASIGACGILAVESNTLSPGPWAGCVVVACASFAVHAWLFQRNRKNRTEKK